MINRYHESPEYHVVWNYRSSVSGRIRKGERIFKNLSPALRFFTSRVKCAEGSPREAHIDLYCYSFDSQTAYWSRNWLFDFGYVDFGKIHVHTDNLANAMRYLF